MKNNTIFTSMVSLLSGCIIVPSNSNPSSNSAIKGTQSVENSKSVTRTTTRGPLLCETSQICPELAIDWIKQQIEHHISAYIYNVQKIDLNISLQKLRIAFLNLYFVIEDLYKMSLFLQIYFRAIKGWFNTVKI